MKTKSEVFEKIESLNVKLSQLLIRINEDNLEETTVEIIRTKAMIDALEWVI